MEVKMVEVKGVELVVEVVVVIKVVKVTVDVLEEGEVIMKTMKAWWWKKSSWRR